MKQEETILKTLPQAEELAQQALGLHFKQNETIITGVIEKMKERAQTGFFSYDMDVIGLEPKQINGIGYVLQSLGYHTDYFPEEKTKTGIQPEILFISWLDLTPAMDTEEMFL